MTKEFTHNDIAEMKQLACNHSDAVPNEECPNCGFVMVEEVIDDFINSMENIAIKDKEE